MIQTRLNGEKEYPVNSPIEFFSSFSRAYAFTNEHVPNLLEEVDPKNKKIIGIIGGGEYCLNSIAFGCNSFTGIDISTYAKYFTELKKASIETFSYLEFLNFYRTEENGEHLSYSKEKYPEIVDSETRAFNPDQYLKLRAKLSNESRDFFDSIIGKVFTPDKSFDRDQKTFEPMALAFHYLRLNLTRQRLQWLNYLRNEEIYDEFSKRLRGTPNPNLIQGDFREKVLEQDSNFDIIYCSNIRTYIDRDERENYFGDLESKLNPNGVLLETV